MKIIWNDSVKRKFKKKLRFGIVPYNTKIIIKITREKNQKNLFKYSILELKYKNSCSNS